MLVLQMDSLKHFVLVQFVNHLNKITTNLTVYHIVTVVNFRGIKFS